QDLFLGRLRRRGGGRGFLPLEHVDRLDHQEDAEGQDEEVDADGDEVAVGEDGAHLSRGVERGSNGLAIDFAGGGHDLGPSFAVEPDVEVAEVDVPGDADDRHDDVFHQRVDDGAEGPADDDADGEVDHAAPH